MASTPTQAQTFGEQSLNRHSRSFRRSTKPSISNTVPYRRRARPSSAQQDEFAYLSSEDDDEGDDDEICKFGDSFSDLKSALPVAKSKMAEEAKEIAANGLVNAIRPKGDAQAEHNRSYFALLKKIASLERENEQLRNGLSSAQQDAVAYAEVARECEDKYRSEVANTMEWARRAVSAEASAKAGEARLAVQLGALQLPSSCSASSARQLERVQDWVGASCTAEIKKHASLGDSSRACSDASATVDGSRHLHQFQDLCWSVSAAASDVVCPRRLQRQNEAIEYRRSVRHQLQTAASAAAIAGACRSSGLFACSKSDTAMKLTSLLATPRDVLDGEVMSDDEEEQEDCRIRRLQWSHALMNCHEV